VIDKRILKLSSTLAGHDSMQNPSNASYDATRSFTPHELQHFRLSENGQPRRDIIVKRPSLITNYHRASSPSLLQKIFTRITP